VSTTSGKSNVLTLQMTGIMCSDFPVKELASRGVLKIDMYVDEILDKLCKPESNGDGISMFESAFVCLGCSVLCKDAAMQVTRKFNHRKNYILPPLGCKGTKTAVLLLFDFYIYSLENGPIIPVLIHLEDKSTTRSRLIDLYRSTDISTVIQKSLNQEYGQTSDLSNKKQHQS
jgi:hypothetical protein